MMSRLRDPRLILGTVVVLAAMVASRLLAPVPLPHIQLPPEAIPGWHIGPIAITNTMTAILQADLVLLLVAFLATRNLQMVPSGLQNFFESIIEFWETQSIQMIGERLTRSYLPWALTIFLLIWVANWSELVPGYDSVGVIVPVEHAASAQPAAPASELVEPGEQPSSDQGHTLFTVPRQVAGIGLLGRRVEDAAPGAEGFEFVPFLRVASSDLNFTIGLALVAFFLIELAGFRELGVGYLGKFFNIRHGFIGAFVGILEFISELARIISYSFRLFGNLFAGQVLLFVVPFLIPLFAPLPVFGLELFAGMIQAYVFAILALAFISQAVVAHDH